MLAVKIAGSGWYLPERRVSNAELAEQMGTSAGWIERVTGIQERRYVTGETSLSMGVEASRMALVDAGLQIGDLDAIISAAAAPVQAIPCTASLLQRELHAPEGVSACFDLNATCLGFLFALQTAAHLVAAGAYRNILICCSEVASSSLNPQERESMVLFGDAAAAVIISRNTSDEKSALWHAQFETHSSGADLTQILGGGTLHHPNHPATRPEMNLFHMSGPAVFKQGSLLIQPFLARFFSNLGWTPEQIDAVVPHQASRHAVEQLTKRLGFTGDQVVLNLARRGNCISASIPLAFSEAAHAGRIQRGDRVLLVGTGAGLTLGALALTY